MGYDNNNLTIHLEFNQDMEWKRSRSRDLELFEKSGDTASFCCLTLILQAKKYDPVEMFDFAAHGVDILIHHYSKLSMC